MFNKFSFSVLAVSMAFLFNLSACGDSGSNSNPENLEEIDGKGNSSENEGESKGIPGDEKEGVESSESAEAYSSSSEAEEYAEPESSSSEFVYADSSYYYAEKNMLMDFRDGKTYRTTSVVVTTEEGDETQVWMAKNLNLEYNEGSAKSFCREDDPEDCIVYGRRYRWSAAMDSAGLYSEATKGCGYNLLCKATVPVRGICPKGWHLPTANDFKALIEMAGGKNEAKKLMATSGWEERKVEGTDDYGFTARPAGSWDRHEKPADVGSFAYFWTMVQYVNVDKPVVGESISNEAGAMKIDGYGMTTYSYSKEMALSVRCLKDSE